VSLTVCHRPETGLAIVRLDGRVTLEDHIRMIEAWLSPGSPLLTARAFIVDARSLTAYDLGFSEMMRMSTRLSRAFAGLAEAMPFLLLVPDDWRFGMARMFQSLSGIVGNIDVHIYEREADVLRACCLDIPRLDALWQDQSLPLAI